MEKCPLVHWILFAPFLNQDLFALSYFLDVLFVCVATYSNMCGLSPLIEISTRAVKNWEKNIPSSQVEVTTFAVTERKVKATPSCF